MKQPLIELFVKASSVDPGDKGECPFSQKWFMAFYLLVERQLINLRVIPVSLINPPREYTRLDIGKQLPAIAYYRSPEDLDKADLLPDAMYSGNDELEAFMREMFSAEINVDAQEQWVGADLLRSLNHFLRTGSSQQLLANLVSADNHLLNAKTTFLEGSHFAYSDCVLSCKLHLVRIAGAFFRGLNFLEDLQHLRAYMNAVYATKAFGVSCPLDRDILLHYMEKVEFASPEARSQAHHEILALPQDQKTISIPCEEYKAPVAGPRVTCSRVRLQVNSMMSAIEFDRTVGDRLSLLYSIRE